MQIFREIEPLRRFLQAFRKRDQTIGLVPTMGSLHKGHLALVRSAMLANDVTVCSIYVNPEQFNNADDLAAYPRLITRDIEMLEEVDCPALFCPSDGEMYPLAPTVRFDFGTLEHVMEGKFRPGHFSGVALIVSKLLHVVEPDRAYLGQKDWQQVVIVKRLVADLGFHTLVEALPIQREEDGLAMSSRNQRLTPDQRKVATVFYKALEYAKKALHHNPDVATIRETVNEIVSECSAARLEYFEVADRNNLNLLERVSMSREPILCIAGYIGAVRLIDNMFF